MPNPNLIYNEMISCFGNDVINFDPQLCGIAVAAMGAYTIFNTEDLSALIGDSLLKKGAYLLLAAGGAVILVSTVGCFGALTENKCLLVLVIKNHMFYFKNSS